MDTERETKRGRFIMDDDDDDDDDDDGGDDDDDLEFLPPEIITEILCRLPADSAIGCRCRGVCKQWRSLIDHPSFRDAHTRQLISSSPSSSKKFGNYLIPSSCTSSSGLLLFAQQESNSFHLQFVEYNDYVEKLVPELKPSKPITDHPFPLYSNDWGTLLISSCNGLVFMGSTKPNYFNGMFVCNPFTKEYMNLPTITTTDEDDNHEIKGRMAYGFGYLPSSNEYKVVRIYYPKMIGGKGKVSVYTLGGGSWRNKGEIPYWLYNTFHPGFFANGAIHWFTNTIPKNIVSFDLANEEFKVVFPLPRPPSINHVDKLGVLGGCLCVTRSDKTRWEIPKDIWVLNLHTKETGEEEFTWNKKFSIPWKGTTSGANPQIIMKSGKILLRGGVGIISYDSKTKTFNEDDLISYDSKTKTFNEEDLISYDSKTEAFDEDEDEDEDDDDGMLYDPNWLKVIPYAKSFVSLKALGEKYSKHFGGLASHALA